MQILLVLPLLAYRVLFSIWSPAHGKNVVRRPRKNEITPLLLASRRAVITLLLNCSRRRLRRRYFLWLRLQTLCKHLFYCFGEKQAQGLHFGLSEQERVARGGYLGGIAFVSFRTPRASWLTPLLVHGIPALHYFKIARGGTPGLVFSYLLPASRRAVITLIINCSRRRLRRRFLFYGYFYRHFAKSRFIASAGSRRKACTPASENGFGTWSGNHVGTFFTCTFASAEHLSNHFFHL